MKLGGSPTDNNAILFRQGQMDIVQPLRRQADVKIVADQWVDNWDAANALKIDGEHPDRPEQQSRRRGCLE